MADTEYAVVIDTRNVDVPTEVAAWLLSSDGLNYVLSLLDDAFRDGYENGVANQPNQDFLERKNDMNDSSGGISINTNFEGWKAVFETYLQDTTDGRLYWEDLMDRVIQGRFPSISYDMHMDEMSIRENGIEEVSYEEGYVAAVDAHESWCKDVK